MLRHLGPEQLPNPRKGRAALLKRARRVADRFGDYLVFHGLCDWESARDWYSDARRGVQERWPERWETACGVLAATSPQCDVQRNLGLAADILKRKSLKGWRPYLPCHEGNVHRALAGEPLSGQKVENYRLALLGHETIVIDSWMLRAAGLGYKANDVRVAYEAVKLARDAYHPELRLEQVQAIIWMSYRTANWVARKGPGTGRYF